MIENKNVENEILLEENIIKTKNIFPNDHRYLTFLKKVFRHEFRKNGFKRLSTPFFEKKEYFENIFPNKVDENVINFKLSEENKI
jgi:histidyl-tRNA synthetase